MSRPNARCSRFSFRNLLWFPRLAGNSRGGLGLAAQQRQALVWFMGLGLWTAVGGGCVTDTISFDRKPVGPPIIEDSPTNPTDIKIGRPFWVDANKGREWSMEVLVREKDPNRALVARHRIYVPETTEPEDQPFDPVPVPQGSIEKPQERTLRFTVSTTSLEPDKCHQLDLVVSGSFDPDDVTVPSRFDLIRDRAQEHDIDRAGWSVWEGDEDSAEVGLFKSCGAEVLMQDVAPTATEEEP
jgi:hypothetical protein